MRKVHKLGHEFKVLSETTIQPAAWDFWSYFEDGTWEPATFRALSACLHPGVTCLDVGAWIGPITMVASKLCDAVIAVEPDPVALTYLLQHIWLNGLTNVTVRDCAVGDGRPVMLGRKENHAFGDSMTSVLYPTDAFEVRTLPLASLVPRNCGLIKMDIEGAEQFVLEGFELPCPMWLSTHPQLVPDLTEYEAAIDRFLSGHQVVLVDELDMLIVP